MKCRVKGCTNHSEDGRFVGEFCSPCYRMLGAGFVSPSEAWFVKEIEEVMIVTEREMLVDILGLKPPCCVTGYSVSPEEDYTDSPRIIKVGINYTEVRIEYLLDLVNYYLDKKLKEIQKTVEVDKIVVTQQV